MLVQSLPNLGRKLWQATLESICQENSRNLSRQLPGVNANLKAHTLTCRNHEIKVDRNQSKHEYRIKTIFHSNIIYLKEYWQWLCNAEMIRSIFLHIHFKSLS